MSQDTPKPPYENVPPVKPMDTPDSGGNTPRPPDRPKGGK